MKRDQSPVCRIRSAAFQQKQGREQTARCRVMVRRIGRFSGNIRLPWACCLAQIVTGADDPFLRCLRGGHDLRQMFAQIGIRPVTEEFQCAVSALRIQPRTNGFSCRIPGFSGVG